MRNPQENGPVSTQNWLPISTPVDSCQQGTRPLLSELGKVFGALSPCSSLGMRSSHLQLPSPNGCEQCVQRFHQGVRFHRRTHRCETVNPSSACHHMWLSRSSKVVFASLIHTLSLARDTLSLSLSSFSLSSNLPCNGNPGANIAYQPAPLSPRAPQGKCAPDIRSDPWRGASPPRGSASRSRSRSASRRAPHVIARRTEPVRSFGAWNGAGLGGKSEKPLEKQGFRFAPKKKQHELPSAV